MEPFREGKHFPSKNSDVQRAEVDIVQLRLAWDDRINRMIPAPSGVSIFDPEDEKENQDRDLEVDFNCNLYLAGFYNFIYLEFVCVLWQGAGLPGGRRPQHQVSLH